MADGNDNGNIKLVNPVHVADEELRQWLENHIKQFPQKTTVVLARNDHIGGTSRTALDSYLNGTYYLPKDKGGAGVNPGNSQLEEKIRAYRERIEGAVHHGYASEFVESRAWNQIQQAIQVAINEKVLVVVYGEPGIGKTHGLHQYGLRQMHSNPIIITCSRNITPRYFVQKIAKALNLSDNKSTPELEDLAVEKLRKSPRVIFVDQANYLSEKSLGTICYLWDLSRVPIVLFGTHELHKLFMTASQNEDVRAQLTSRVALQYPLATLTAEDCVTIIKRALGERATPDVVASIINVTKNNHRHLDFTIRRILFLLNMNSNKKKLDSGKITMGDIVNSAASRLMIG